MLSNPIRAAEDKPQVYADGCWNGRPFSRHKVCSYGPKDAPVTVALYGNSHAGQWFPPILKAAQERGWALDTYLASGCYSVDIPVQFPAKGRRGRLRRMERMGSVARLGGRVRPRRQCSTMLSGRSPGSGTSSACTLRAQKPSLTPASVFDGFRSVRAPVLGDPRHPTERGHLPDCVARYPARDGRRPPMRTGAAGPISLADAPPHAGARRMNVRDVRTSLSVNGSCPQVIVAASTSTYFETDPHDDVVSSSDSLTPGFSGMRRSLQALR
jgi:hypothetical protein